MPKVLTTGSLVFCGHPPGKVSTFSSAKLKVQGQSVPLESSIEGSTIVACPQRQLRDSH